MLASATYAFLSYDLSKTGTVLLPVSPVLRYSASLDRSPTASAELVLDLFALPNDDVAIPDQRPTQTY
ncbi:MAG: hypothetical protein EOO85_21865 [Pedobacter sp.]|nr:MAG: hypothetical protein EOO85_21865 [Pedobacter sp.]